MSSKKNKKIKGATVSLQEFNSRLENTPTNGQNVIYAPKVASSGSWAQEMEEEDIFIEKERIVLPSAPRASRMQQQVESIPNTAPFTAHLGNISYDISEEDVNEFFQDQKVVGLRLPREGTRLKGYGYVEFETRDDLIEALGLDGQILRGRPLRVSIGTQGTNARGGQGEDRRGGGGKYDTDDTPDDWRREPGQVVDSLRPDAFEGRRGGGGGGFSGGYGRRDDYGGGGRRNDYGGGRSDYGGGRNDYGGGRNDFGGGRNDFGGRNAYGGGRDDFGGGRSDFAGRSDMVQSRRPPPEDWRTGGGGPRQNAYDDRRGGYGGRNDYNSGGRSDFAGRSDMVQRRTPPEDWRTGGGQVVSNVRHERPDSPEAFSEPRGGFTGNRSRQDSGRSRQDSDRGSRQDSDGDRNETEPRRPSQQAEPPSQPRERKKLNLAPRTKPLVDEPAPESSASIFGGAKPVDTSAREREIEDKLNNLAKLEIETDAKVEGRRGFDDSRERNVGFKGPVRILKRNEGASALNSNAMPPLINNNRRQQRGFSHGRERTTSSDSSQPSSTHHRHEEYENSEPEDERDLRRQQAMQKDVDNDGFIEVQKRRSNHNKVGAPAAAAPATSHK